MLLTTRLAATLLPSSVEATRHRVSGADQLEAAIPLGVASLVVGCLVWTARFDSLPALPFAAGFLFLAVWQDVEGLRIPNWLTGPALLGAFGLAGLQAGWSGLATSAAGAGVALAVLFGPFALGALWGALPFLQTLWWMLLAGGLVAAALLVARGGVGELVCRWRTSFELWLTTRRFEHLGPDPGTTAAQGIPFAVAMGLGASAFQIWGLPWL
jgi:prepilin peptidase CpaA